VSPITLPALVPMLISPLFVFIPVQLAFPEFAHSIFLIVLLSIFENTLCPVACAKLIPVNSLLYSPVFVHLPVKLLDALPI